ncbi:MAG: protease inhibitor I42 family protein [Coriobacteriales bacterium]|jgi:inhibitor of cysteine peptidase|nr:protease inhibitor I42 family protein [Coriobacteriales bacterium]
MSKKLLVVALLACTLVVAALAVGCTQKPVDQGADQTADQTGEPATATIELKGNPTTGYTWVYTMIPEGIIKEVSNDYEQDTAAQGATGVGGTFKYVFEAVSEGETELTFSYLREFEDNPAEQVVVYKAKVDAGGNITLTEVQAPKS